MPNDLNPAPSYRQKAQLKRQLLAAALLALSASAVLAQSRDTSASTGIGPTSPAASASSISLPSLGDNEMAPAAERRIGDRIAASIYRDPDYIDDPVLGDYVRGIWLLLMDAARARGELNPELQERFAWDLFLIRDRTVNAFALPGGYFGLHLGLVNVVNTRDELAAVLGHELSHVTQRHISRLMTQQGRQAPWMIGAMILGALAASKNPQAASAAIVGGQAMAAQNQLDFSRDMEREADRVGFGVMTDAGFDSRGAASMFDKLQQASRLNDNGSFPYLRSHPLNTQRLAEAQSRFQLTEKPLAAPNSPEAQALAKARVLHAMMAARSRVLVEPGVDTLRGMANEAQRVASATASGSASTNSDAGSNSSRLNSAASPNPSSAPPKEAAAASNDARTAGTLYAGVFAAARLRDFALAARLATPLKNLCAGHPEALKAIDLLLLEVDLLAGKVPAGAAGIKLAQAASRAEVLLGARALLAAARAPEVSERLQTWVSANPRDAAAWQLLSLAYGNQGQAVRAIRAEAEARFAQLDYAGALDRFKAAQGLMRSQPASADFVEGSIVDTRTRQVEALLKEQALQDKLDR